MGCQPSLLDEEALMAGLSKAVLEVHAPDVAAL